MPKISLTSYIVRIKSRSSKQYMKIGSYKEGADFLEKASGYLRSLENSNHVDLKKQKILGSTEIHVEDRLIYGIIKSGEFGFACDLFDTESCLISYRRQVHDADLMPFYFLLELPENSDEGILILQKFNQLGIKGLFTDFLKERFHQEQEDFLLDVQPLIPEQILEQFMNDGRVIKINLTRFRLPSDIADAFDGQSHRELNGTTELVLKASRNGHFPMLGRIREWINERKPLKEFVAIENFDYDTVRIGVDFNGNIRTFDLSDLYRINPSLDISSQVVLADGHPTFSSINSVAMSFLEDLARQIRGSNNQ